MRLTLRTLLAYMDDILEPSDQQELAQKIETSEFAADLIHRTRDTMRRLRLSAPQALGSGLGLDPNTVAEYLDNTLTPDNVADLERICLESDVHLAEVAACHHILTMVLGEPAEIDIKSRQRMYAIADELEARQQLTADTAQSAPVAAAAATGTDVPGESGSEIPSSVASSTIVEVPDYLRASRWSPFGIGAGVAAIAVGIAVLVFLGRAMFGGGTEEDMLALSGEQPSVSTSTTPENAAPTGEDAASLPEVAGTDEENTTDPTADQDPAVEDSPAPSEGVQVQPPPVIVPAAEPLVSTPVETSAPVDTPLPTETTVPVGSPTDPGTVPPLPDTDVPAGDAGGEDVSASEGLVAADNQQVLPPPEMDNVTLPESVGATVPATTDASAEGSVAAPVADATSQSTADAGSETAAPPPTELGTFWADRNLLLRYDPSGSNWFPLATGSTIEVGDQLLSLPTFRPTVALRSGIGVKLVGATSIQLFDRMPDGQLPDSGAAEGAALAITYGRVELINSGEAGNPIHVIVGQTTGTLLMGPGAVVVLNVERRWVPGNDPLTTPSPVEAMAFAPNGNVTWIVEDQAHPVEKPAQWQVGDGLPVQLVEPANQDSWLETESLGRLERSAAEQIRDRLTDPQYPASMVLLDVSNSRRREEVALATRCAVYVGEFAPFVKALGDSDQRSSWELHIQTLRAALSLSPESAAKVRRTLYDQRGDPAASDMFEMLCGYSLEDIGMTPQQRRTGALDRLINFLESDSLDYRVLANYNLREITGKNLMPNPTSDPQERARGVRRWRQRLESGELEPLDSYGW